MQTAKEVSVRELIPTLNSAVFACNDEARFAVGLVAVGKEVLPGLVAEFQGYALLRGNVYAREKRYVPLDQLSSDGAELDDDDPRAAHFVSLENHHEGVRVVGSMRVIVKMPDDPRPLPVEIHYPEAFVLAPAPVLSVEVSQLICRHERPAASRELKWLLFAAGVSFVLERHLGPVYGAVENVLYRGLLASGVPVTALSAEKFIPEFNATKLTIQVDVHGLAGRLESREQKLWGATDSGTGFAYAGRR